MAESVVVQTVSYEDETDTDSQRAEEAEIRGPSLGKSWKLLASVNLFILSLKSKWRRNRRGRLAGLTGGFVLHTGAIYEAVPRLLVNNWTLGGQSPIGGGQCSNSRSPSPRGSAVGGGLYLGGGGGGDGSRPSTGGSSAGFSRRLTSFVGMHHTHGSGQNSARRMSVRNVWQNLTRGRSDSAERRSSAGLGMIDARDGYHWPVSVTRQLAFGPWETGASRSKIHGYMMKIPFAKVITVVIFLICVIVVSVIYVKEAEVEEKLKQKYGWT